MPHMCYFSKAWEHQSEFYHFCFVSFPPSLYKCNKQANTVSRKQSAAVLDMILLHHWPTLCHSLCREDRNGVRLLSLRAPFDHTVCITRLHFEKICSAPANSIFTMTAVCLSTLHLLLCVCFLFKPSACTQIFCSSDNFFFSFLQTL